MNRAFLFIALCLSIILFACQNSPNKYAPSEELKYDSLTTAIIAYDLTNSKHRIIFDSAKNESLTNANLKTIENSIDKVLDSENTKRIGIFNSLDSQEKLENQFLKEHTLKSDEYYRRYLVVRNSNGEKEVYVALACLELANDQHFNLKKSIDQGHGGGICIISFKINLNKGKIYNIEINDEA